MKIAFCFILATFLAGSTLITARAEGSGFLQLAPSENCHIVELNSDQPYAAGYQVIEDDFSTYGAIDGTAVTVSFLSVDPAAFSPGDWLGGGMFLQAQDTMFKHVDYGFYMVLVVDFSGRLFIDVGLHQTRELSLPVQLPTKETVYAYSWQLLDIDITTPITLIAYWGSGKTVHYSISSARFNMSVMSINPADLPNCENIIPKFYQGNIIVNPFPFSRYVNYFQVGVISPRIRKNDNWQVCLNEPMVLQEARWAFVGKARPTHGEISYLDADWRWGGQSYEGVNTQYSQNPLLNSVELVFHYDGNALPRPSILWDLKKPSATNINQICGTILCSLGESVILTLILSFKRKTWQSQQGRARTTVQQHRSLENICRHKRVPKNL